MPAPQTSPRNPALRHLAEAFDRAATTIHTADHAAIFIEKELQRAGYAIVPSGKRTGFTGGEIVAALQRGEARRG